jgi:hypothetical protein
VSAKSPLDLLRKWWEEDLSSLPPWEITAEQQCSFLKELESQLKKVCDHRDWHCISDILEKYVNGRSNELHRVVRYALPKSRPANWAGVANWQEVGTLERPLSESDYDQLRRLQKFSNDAFAQLDAKQKRGQLDEAREYHGNRFFIEWYSSHYEDAWTDLIADLAVYFSARDLQPSFGSLAREVGEQTKTRAPAAPSPFVWLVREAIMMVPKDLRLHMISVEATRKQASRTYNWIRCHPPRERKVIGLAALEAAQIADKTERTMR